MKSNNFKLGKILAPRRTTKLRLSTVENNSPKIPWYLRVREALNLKQIASTLGIGTIYDLLIAGILFILFKANE